MQKVLGLSPDTEQVSVPYLLLVLPVRLYMGLTCEYRIMQLISYVSCCSIQRLQTYVMGRNLGLFH